MEVNKSIFKRQADFLEKNGKYILQFTDSFKENHLFESITKITYNINLFLLIYFPPDD